MKIRTDKYVIYKTGQVYKNDPGTPFLRTLTDNQTRFINEFSTWRTRHDRNTLEKLIDGGDAEFDSFMATVPLHKSDLSFKAVEVPKANDIDTLLQRPCIRDNCNFLCVGIHGDSFVFFCRYCLQRVAKPVNEPTTTA